MHDREVNFRRIEIINQMESQKVNIFELNVKLVHFNPMPRMNLLFLLLNGLDFVHVNSLTHMHIH